MKFSTLSTFLVLPLLAVATPWGAPPPVTTTVTVTAPASSTPVSQCMQIYFLFVIAIFSQICRQHRTDPMLSKHSNCWLQCCFRLTWSPWGSGPGRHRPRWSYLFPNLSHWTWRQFMVCLSIDLFRGWMLISFWFYSTAQPVCCQDNSFSKF